MDKHEIKSISFKIVDSDGTSLKDTRDIKPIQKQFNKNKSYIELLMESVVPLEWMCDEFFNKFGHDASTTMNEKWSWDIDKINKASIEDIWKAYGLISGYWLNKYEHWYNKEVYEFRLYRRKQGEDLDTFEIQMLPYI